MNATLEIKKTVCPGCLAILDVGDRFCRHCGTVTRPGDDPLAAADRYWRPTAPAASADPREPAPAACTCQCQASAAEATERPRFSESPWFVLPVVFLVLGPLGIPMLWRSRQITLLFKGLLTVGVLALTAYMGAMIWHTIQVSLAPLEELQRIQGL